MDGWVDNEIEGCEFPDERFIGSAMGNGQLKPQVSRI